MKLTQVKLEESMNRLEFIANLIEALAWPVVMLIIEKNHSQSCYWDYLGSNIMN